MKLVALNSTTSNGLGVIITVIVTTTLRKIDVVSSQDGVSKVPDQVRWCFAGIRTHDNLAITCVVPEADAPPTEAVSWNPHRGSGVIYDLAQPFDT